MAFLGIPTSRKDLGNAGWIKGVSTVGARAGGNVASAVGDTSGARRLRGFADAVDDPNQGYTGTLNPISFATGAPNTGMRSFNQSSPASQPQVQGVSENRGPQQAVNDLNAGGLYSGGGRGGGGGAAVEEYDPNTDLALVNSAKGEVSGLMKLFEEAFTMAMGKVDTLAGSKRGEVSEKYTGEKDSLSRNFGDTSNTIDNQFSGRNAFNSSYRANEQGVAKDAFDDAFSGLGRAEETDLSSIGQFADTQKAELNASRPTYDLNDYNEVDDVLNIKQNVDQAVKNLGVTNAGLGTNSQFRQSLDRIAPKTAHKGNATLKAQLDRLAQTNANPQAKRFIAEQTISDAGQDPAAWIDYFEEQQLLTGSQAQNNSPLVVQ